MRNRRLQAPLVLREAFVLFAATLLALTPGHAMAGKFKVIYSFCSKNDCRDGYNPTGSLVMDPAGNLYGTTLNAGGSSIGAAYELERQETGKYNYKVLYRFQGGLRPAGSLIIDTQGNFYGELTNAQFFKLSYGFGKNHDKWGLTLITPSCSQQNCGTGLVGGLSYAGQSTGAPWDGASPLYGAAGGGGTKDAGTVFQLDPNGGQWTQTVLYNFCSQGGDKCTDGAGPRGSVFLDSIGNLYGTTFGGGGNDANSGGAGILYELSPSESSWSETVLHRFCALQDCTDGHHPSGNLLMDNSGELFGTTEIGGGKCSLYGKDGCGVLFKLVPNGEASEETVLYAFCNKRDCDDGAGPVAGPVIDADGNLFGTTMFGGGNDIDFEGLGGGVAYEFAASTYKALRRFCASANCADGEYPQSSLIINSSGNLLGTTWTGGAANGGVIFRVTRQ